MSLIYHVGISGGKDSTALLLWMVRESGIDPALIRASFCDTGNEVGATIEHIAMLSETIHPIETLRPELDFYQLAVQKKRFPSARARFCTHELKIKPTMVHVKSMQDAGHEVVLCSGVRRGESFERSTLDEKSYNEIYDCDEWRPLIAWSIADVWAIHERHGIPRNPLYEAGATRVGCAPCVMSRMSEIALLARKFPERIDRIRQAEAEGRDTPSGSSTFFHHAKVPLRFRSEPWRNPKTGEVIYLATIDDVIARVNAIDDGTQEAFDFGADLPAACADRWGLCE